MDVSVMLLGADESMRSSIAVGSPEYPGQLRESDDPPAVLNVIGDAGALRPGLAVVGARKATPYGIACAEHFAAIAAARGVPIISGGAIGCDQAAHRGALGEGGTTVVVLGSGADVVYPRSGKELFKRVLAEGGALVSEQPWGGPPLKWAFKRRNRIIAGLAKAVLIVEAGLPSGTFSTADYALNGGREVLVVPGSIFSRESHGSNTLLRQGAQPIVDDGSFADALDDLFGPVLEMGPVEEGLEEPMGADGRVLKVLAAAPASAEELIGIAGADVKEVLRVLSALEVRKKVERYPDGRFGLGRAVMLGR